MGSLTLIQPAAAAGLDTMLYSPTPTTNYGTFDQAYVAGATDTSRALLKFDLSTLAGLTGARVKYATLWWPNYAAASGTPGTITAHRVTADWTEAGATWNKRTASDNWVTPGGDFEAAALDTLTVQDYGYQQGYAWLDIDLTAQLKRWLDGTDDNFGVLLQSATASFTHIVRTSDDADATLHPYFEVENTDSPLRLRFSGDGYYDRTVWVAGVDWNGEPHYDATPPDKDLAPAEWKLLNLSPQLTTLKPPLDMWARAMYVWKGNPLATPLPRSFTVEAASIPADQAITEVTVTVRGTTHYGSGTAPTVRIGLRIGGTDYWGEYHRYPPQSPDSFDFTHTQEHAWTWATNPATLAAWTPAEVDVLEVVGQHDAGDLGTILLLRAVVSVPYTEGAGDAVPTWTDELSFWNIDPGEVYSAGSHAANFDQIDSSIATYRLDAGRNGIVGVPSCALTIAGAGQSVAIAAGTAWHNSMRYLPDADSIGGADGLATATPGNYAVYYDPADTGSPYYATTGVANDAQRDVFVGWVTVAAGSATVTRSVPRLGRDADTPHLYAGTATAQTARDYPLLYGPIRTALAAGVANVTLTRPYSGAGSYVVTATPETAGTGRLSVGYTSGSAFTVNSTDTADARFVRCLVVGHEGW